MILLYNYIIKSIKMSQLEYQLEILKNFQYQNKILLQQIKLSFNNEILLKRIYKKINYINKIIDIYYQQINTNNILLIFIFILQIFILFK